MNEKQSRWVQCPHCDKVHCVIVWYDKESNKIRLHETPRGKENETN